MRNDKEQTQVCEEEKMIKSEAQQKKTSLVRSKIENDPEKTEI